MLKTVQLIFATLFATSLYSSAAFAIERPQIRFQGRDVVGIKWILACAKGGAPAVALGKTELIGGYEVFLCEGQGAVDPKKPLNCNLRFAAERGGSIPDGTTTYSNKAAEVSLALYHDSRADLSSRGTSYQDLRCSRF